MCLIQFIQHFIKIYSEKKNTYIFLYKNTSYAIKITSQNIDILINYNITVIIKKTILKSSCVFHFAEKY